MELTIYDIIRGPVISDKAYKLNQQLKQLLLEIHQHANKAMVKNALEKLFDVKVKTIRTANRKYTTARASTLRHKARPSVKTTKVAYVTLAEGYSLNFFEQVGAQASEQDTNKESKE